MENSFAPKSALVADCGAAATKVGLIDWVDGEYRLAGVGRELTTSEPPTADICVGLGRAVAQLETWTGRQMLDAGGDLLRPAQPGDEGADALAATTSAALPLRVAMIGLSRDLSLATARRATASSFAIVENSVAVDEESGRWGTTARDGRAGGASAAVEKLAASRPDVIIMAGGVDGGANSPLYEMANIVASIGAAMDESTRPAVIFAGNSAARAAVAERIDGRMALRAVENLRPALNRENFGPLQRELETIYCERRITQLAGFPKLASWSASSVVPTVSAYEKVVQFLARRHSLNVLAIDLGAAATTMIYSDGNECRRVIEPEVGLGYGLETLVRAVGIDRIVRWLPNSVGDKDAHARLLNQALRPWTTPTAPEDHLALNAAAREAIAVTAERWQDGLPSQVDLMLLSGAPLARGAGLNALMLMALDAFPMSGVFSVAVDTSGIASALGSLAVLSPDAAAEVLERDIFLTLGTAVTAAVTGAQPGAPALLASVETPSMGRLEVQVPAGSLEVLPLRLGEKAKVQLKPERGVTLDLPLKRGVFERELEGGAVGLVIDARGRPLALSPNGHRQREQAQRWLREVGA